MQVIGVIWVSIPLYQDYSRVDSSNYQDYTRVLEVIIPLYQDSTRVIVVIIPLYQDYTRVIVVVIALCQDYTMDDNINYPPLSRLH